MEYVHFNVFELLMLVCFGMSWPFAVIKTLRTKKVVGKSFMFLCLVFCGYLAGIRFKLERGGLDVVLAAYCFNACMVFTEVALYIYFERLICRWLAALNHIFNSPIQMRMSVSNLIPTHHATVAKGHQRSLF